MLTYIEVHIYYTLPVIFLALLLYRPFYTKSDTFKLVFLSTVALVTASPWDNYIVYHKAWWYCPNCVLFVIGYVPIEEYMFFVIMTVMTTIFTGMVMRWDLPTLHLKIKSPLQSTLIRYVPIAGFASAAVWGWFNAIPKTQTFYGGCILWYTMPVLGLLWWGAGNYIVSRFVPFAISIIVPTIYLCWVDIVALRAGTWHINEATSTGIFVIDVLPLEEFGFFFLVNCVLVFACCAIDKTDAIMNTFPQIVISCKYHKPQDVSNLPQMEYFAVLVRAFAITESNLPQDPINDLVTSLHVLSEASKSFNTASAVFSPNIRQDLGILYAFCRVTDDMADNAETHEKRREALAIIRRFVDELFSTASSKKPPTKLQDPTLPPRINWPYYASKLPAESLAAFRAISRIAHYMPSGPFYELIAGYQWDLDATVVKNENDLLKYSTYVASSVGELCVCVMMYKSGMGNWNGSEPRNEWVIERAREMGQVLQLVNISRDIITDSTTLGRCYVPLTYFSSADKDYASLTRERKPLSVGEDQLRGFAIRMLYLADNLSKSASEGIAYLPAEVQRGAKAAAEVYQGIGAVVRRTSGYQQRARMSMTGRAWIAFKCLYGSTDRVKVRSESKIRKTLVTGKGMIGKHA
ncbi:phytoene synthase [Jimgerdemannia flammicorona]|uniref:Bifunctional lycopene cyclase/phytoene synthase n=1 Tax=Jimgerdemannia flammicorona TaxID=994334 RepID=A0A433QJY2_9FUNG|nr:phytoene synthase [Jimgerdemannia flammicorona]